MENKFLARVGALFGKEKFLRTTLLVGLSSLLFGCAQSDVSREVTANIDVGVQNTRDMASSAGDGSLADSYQNASQATKGAFIGGAAGAITGTFTPGLGTLAGTAVGAILGGSYGAYIESNASLEDQLQNRGANVVILGDQILIVIPSARIFNPLTPTIKTTAFSTLNMVTRFINQYTKMLVKVAVYTNNTGSRRIDAALSQQQANSVSKYLQAAGIDARLLYAAGYGGTHLVTSTAYDWEASDNYRIEITLEKLYV